MRVLYKSSLSVCMKAYFILFVLGISGCKKFIDVKAPVTSSNAENVYNSDATAIAVVTGIYSDISLSGLSLGTTLFLATGLSADELVVNVVSNEQLVSFYRNSLMPSSHSWSKLYNYIFIANSAIEGLSKSSGLTPGVKQQLLGEAKFARAFCYLYLVNLYGDVPLATSTDYKINAMLPRATSQQVYAQIITDLKEAKDLLSETYLGGDLQTQTADRVRPTKWAATALLARTYLYTANFPESEVEATALINHQDTYGLTRLDETFLKNSREAIWQIQPVGTDFFANTLEGQLFVPQNQAPFSVPVYLNLTLVESFEPNDQRKNEWVDSLVATGSTFYFSHKYKIGTESRSEPTEYSMMLRLGEQYLIRAEARVKQGNISGAQEDLNLIRARAQLPATDATSPEDFDNAILHERQVELFTEWGHRWLDLKRAGRTDAVLAPIKGNDWQTTDQLYPIPQFDIDRNPSLAGHQNPGYN